MHSNGAAASPWTRLAHADALWRYHILAIWPSWMELLPLLEQPTQPPLPLWELFARRMDPDKLQVEEEEEEEEMGRRMARRVLSSRTFSSF